MKERSKNLSKFRVLLCQHLYFSFFIKDSSTVEAQQSNSLSRYNMNGVIIVHYCGHKTVDRIRLRVENGQWAGDSGQWIFEEDS